MTMLRDCFLPEHQELKPQRWLSSLQNRCKTFPSKSILMMLIDSQVLATIYFLLLSVLKMA